MKKLLLIALAFGGFSAMAQKEVGVELITPADGYTVSAGQPFDLSFTVTNTGTVAYATTDSVYFQLYLNETPVSGGYWAQTANTALAVGASYTFTWEDVAFNQISVSGSNDLCVVVALFEGTSLEPVDEANSTDNVSCNTMTFVPGTAGINEPAVVEAITMYPNPVSDKLTFKTEGAVLSAINVHNLAGQLVSTIEVSATGTTTYDAAALEAGIYVVSFIGENGVSVKTEKLSVK